MSLHFEPINNWHKMSVYIICINIHARHSKIDSDSEHQDWFNTININYTNLSAKYIMQIHLHIRNSPEIICTGFMKLVLPMYLVYTMISISYDVCVI